MEIEGTIIFDLGIQEGVSKSTSNPWKKRELVMETFGNYPRKVKFTVFGERRVNELQFEIGKAYRISVDAESREYNGRWYTDLTAYNAQPLEGGMPGIQTAQQPQAESFGQPSAPFGQPMAPAAQDPFASDSNDTDDLPF